MPKRLCRNLLRVRPLAICWSLCRKACIIIGMANKNKHRVLIVGGGFGGVKAALELAKHNTIAVTLVSDRTDFRYYPTLYHTATGGLRAQSSIPLDKILPGSVEVVHGTAEKLDRGKQTVKL